MVDFNLDRIQVVVPSEAPEEAAFSIQVQNVPGWVSSEETFYCMGAPGPARITVTAPLQAGPGQQIKILGVGFNKLANVTLISVEDSPRFLMTSARIVNNGQVVFTMTANVMKDTYRVQVSLTDGKRLLSPETLKRV
jgi:hypothetical protein